MSMIARPTFSQRRALGLSVGLIGVQVIWGLQNVGTTRIFQTLGATPAELPILWIAAPITGLLVQPIVGQLSDRANRGSPQRLPYLGLGALATAAAMLLMVEADTLWLAIVGLWLLTAAVNVTMQPLRALLADELPPAERARGYVIQVIFIGVGAVFASILPWMLTRWGGYANAGDHGRLAPNLRMAFCIGAAVLLLTVAWTLIVARRDVRGLKHDIAPQAASPPPAVPKGRASGTAWTVAGGALGVIAYAIGMGHEIYLLAAIALGYGVLTLLVVSRQRDGRPVRGMLELVANIRAMPLAMRRLAITQFFTWFAMFAMWVYAVPAIAARSYGAPGVASPAYARAADHVGVLFAVSDGSSAVVALILSPLLGRLGLRGSYAACLALSACGMATLAALRDPGLLWLPAIALGAGWAGIMSTPYTIVANSVPPARVGVYMGIHNMFLVVPQLAGACLLGATLQSVFHGNSVMMLWAAAVSLALAAATVALIPPDPATRSEGTITAHAD